MSQARSVHRRGECVCFSAGADASMTHALPFTQASVRRAIAAARKSGLRVRGIGPDGTVIVQDGDNGPAEVHDSVVRGQAGAPSSKWEDAEA